MHRSEPTSGLDSVSALQVINVLKKIARAGCSVLFTIHQPSSEVFASFDNLILLNRGIVMYQGPADKCTEYFANHNYPIPCNHNPADFIMTIAQKYSQEKMLSENFYTKNQLDAPSTVLAQLDTLARAEKETLVNDNKWEHASFLTEIRLLFIREFLNIFRNKLIRARFALTTFISVLVGCIFYDVGNGDDINSHFGALGKQSQHILFE